MKRGLSLILISAIFISLLIAPCAQAEGDYVTARTVLDAYEDGQLQNIRLASESVDGTYLSYGSAFSFNSIVGPRSSENGYVSATNGRGVDVIGGGIGQVATTIYLALLQINNISYNELYFYGDSFTGTYVSSGDAAVLVDYGNGLDFSFTNYASDMLIEVWVSGNYVYCAISLGATSDTWTWSESTTLVSTAAIQINAGDGAILNNIQLASDSIYDTTLSASGLFSFNGAVGARTESNGYVSAVNGRGVDVIGGGVGQVASVIFLAIKNMPNITIVEKSTYGDLYNQSYVSSSADAILVDYNAGTDFSFRYTGSATLTIYTYIADNTLFCDIYENY